MTDAYISDEMALKPCPFCGWGVEEERAGARSGIRDVMVRLGLYDRFVAEKEVD